MKPFTADQVRGNWATVLLPINSDETIDLCRLESDLDVLIDARVDGIYTNGTAGEFLAQTEYEFRRVSEIVARKCEEHDVPFQIGASHVSPQISLERVRFAAQLRPSAIQVILPDWFPVTNDEAIRFLECIAQIAEPIGLVLYNPPHAKRKLTPDDLGSIHRMVPSLIGLKVMDGDEKWYSKMRHNVGALSLFVPGHHLATGHTLGASGSYSNVACLHPRGAQRWYESTVNDIDAALEIEHRINGFFRDHILPFRTEHGFSNAAIDKLLASIGGWASTGTRLRFPYRWIPESVVPRLTDVAKRSLPDIVL